MTVLPILSALAWPTAYAMNWFPLLAGGGFGLLVVVGVPVVSAVVMSPADLTTLLRFAVTAGAVGAAFLLDDPAARGTDVVPTARCSGTCSGCCWRSRCWRSGGPRWSG